MKRKLPTDTEMLDFLFQLCVKGTRHGIRYDPMFENFVTAKKSDTDVYTRNHPSGRDAIAFKMRTMK